MNPCGMELEVNPATRQKLALGVFSLGERMLGRTVPEPIDLEEKGVWRKWYF